MNTELFCLLSEKCRITPRGKSHNGVARCVILLSKMRHPSSVAVPIDPVDPRMMRRRVSVMRFLSDRVYQRPSVLSDRRDCHYREWSSVVASNR